MDRNTPLFSSSPKGGNLMDQPLASRMRPRSLDEFIGQEHIVGPGRLLRRAIQRDQLTSIILSGPPGTGKTTLARIIANTTKSYFIALNAVLSGVGELREAIDKAKTHFELYSKKTILFVDEVHRWNKSQQDALLPWVENGTVILIGATTENPFFEVNRALVSRSRVFLLKSLDSKDLLTIAEYTIGDKERGYGRFRVKFEEGALEHLVYTADGDARSLLNALELAIETSVDSWPAPEDSSVFVSISVAEESIQRKVVLYDKDGDYHYDTISAFIKSIRGSDPDAALYWVSRMIYAGEDPSFIFRRLLISAAEDIGLADPQAVQVVYSCAQAFDRIGMPEGQFHLSLAALYLSTCPKSNSTLGYFDALKAVEAEGAEVPNHLKDASRDSAGFGHGQGYKYPHAYTDHWVAQQYLPSSLAKSVFYTPGSLGLEGERKRSILERREAQLSLLPEDSETDASVWSKEGERRRKWHARAEGLASQRLTIARRWLFDSMSPRRTDSILVIDPRKGFYALEALRRAQEGHVAVFLRDSSAKEQLERLTADLPYLARPSVAVFDKSQPLTSTLLEDSFGFSNFEWLVYCEPPTEGTVEQIPSSLFSSALRGLEAKNDFHCACFDILSGPSSALSSLLDLNCVEPNSSTLALLESLRVFELEWGGGPRFCPDQKGKTEESLKKSFESLVRDSGISTRDFEIVHEKLFFTQSSNDRDVQGFLDQNAAYVDALGSCLGKQAVREIKGLLDSLPPSIRWPLFVARIGF